MRAAIARGELVTRMRNGVEEVGWAWGEESKEEGTTNILNIYKELCTDTKAR